MLSDEFSEWLAYDMIDPFGHDRIDFNHAITSSTIANCHRGKGQRYFMPNDFIPNYGHSGAPKQSPKDMETLMLAIGRAHNKKIERLKKQQEVNNGNGSSTDSGSKGEHKEVQQGPEAGAEKI